MFLFCDRTIELPFELSKNKKKGTVRVWPKSRFTAVPGSPDNYTRCRCHPDKFREIFKVVVFFGQKFELWLQTKRLVAERQPEAACRGVS
jgi:hypothetical protein